MTNDSSGRIAEDLRRWIATAPPAAQLPSTRSLVSRFSASPLTVQKALRALEAEGAIEVRSGVGAFVRASRPSRSSDYGWQTAALGSASRMPPRSTALRSASHETIALHAGYPDRSLLPERLVRGAFARAARGGVALDRPPVAGLPELRSWFAAELGARSRAGIAPPAPNDALIIPGSQSGLSVIFRSLVGRGAPLLVESPTYWGAILAAAQAGVELVPVPSGTQGPDPDALERALVRTGARAFYAQPSFANPTGALWSPALAERVLELARSHGAFVIEDDWAHDFGIAADSVPLAVADDDGHVVYVRSLTKSVSPAVRVAAIIARGPARERILAQSEASSMYVSGVLQAVALDVVTQPAWRTHVRGLRAQLAARRDLLMAALREHAPQLHVDVPPPGGLNLWARLPEGTDVGRFVHEAEASGVMVGAGDEWFPAEPAGPFVRLNYSGPAPERYGDAARILGGLLPPLSLPARSAPASGTARRTAAGSR